MCDAAQDISQRIALRVARPKVVLPPRLASAASSRAAPVLFGASATLSANRRYGTNSSSGHADAAGATVSGTQPSRSAAAERPSQPLPRPYGATQARATRGSECGTTRP